MSSEDVFHLGIKVLIRNKAGEVLLMQVNPAKLNGERKDYWDLSGRRVQKGDSNHTVLYTRSSMGRSSRIGASIE
jgi:hypothetical protein